MARTLPPVPSPVAAAEVADAFIAIADAQVVDVPETGQRLAEGVTNLKLQKLLYFAQAAHLAVHGMPLFDDAIHAWAMGPVVPAVYDRYRGHGAGRLPSPKTPPADPELLAFLREVWKLFGKYSASELVHLSHVTGPWKEAYARHGDRAIEHCAIRDAYRSVFVDLHA